MSELESVEGRIAVLAALEANQRRFECILLKDDIDSLSVESILHLAALREIPVRHVDADSLQAQAHGRSHGGVLARCTPKPLTSGEELLRLLDTVEGQRPHGGDAPLLLLLEGADDARNLGFVLRSAEAFGVHAVLIRKRVLDFDAQEVSRPSSGAYERLALVQVDDLQLLSTLIERGLRLVGCLANVQRSIHDAHLEWPTILAIGGEKRGLSGAVRSLCDRFVRIPTKDGASLALSHSASIALAEAARQRLRPPPVR